MPDGSPPIEASAATVDNATASDATKPRRESMSQRSEDSQTAAEFLRDQMQLEADAREALPYVRHPGHSTIHIPRD